MKKSKYLLPSLFTSASLLFSFLAIVSAFQGSFISCAVYILLAVFADGFDGKIARITDTQTKFGAALDSLADVVSFGATPALAIYFWSLYHLGSLGTAISFLYLLAVALRLAKFDTQLVTSTHMTEEELTERSLYFYGMPCPAGAANISGLIWLGQNSFIDHYPFLILAITSFTALYLAYVMISDIKFRSFKDSDGKGNVSKLYTICFISLIIMLFTIPDKFLYIVMMIYAFSGPINHISCKKKIQSFDSNLANNFYGKR